MATTSFSNWEFWNQRVQQEVTGGQFLSAETTLIAAGPPSLDNPKAQNDGGGNIDDSKEAYPIGLLESFGLQQNRQLQRIFEIGSSRSYFIPGRNIGSIALGRTMYYGPNLLRALYAYYNDTGMNIGTAGPDAPAKTGPDGRAYPDPQRALLPNSQALHVLRRTPGYDYFFVDLASDMFAQPTGMAVYFKDYDGVSVGAFYLNHCYVQGHQLNVSSGSVLIMEGAQMQYDTMTPIQMIQ